MIRTTPLPVPYSYQEMNLDQDENEVRYLYMGDNYVAFTPEQWAEFLTTLNNSE